MRLIFDRRGARLIGDFVEQRLRHHALLEQSLVTAQLRLRRVAFRLEVAPCFPWSGSTASARASTPHARDRVRLARSRTDSSNSAGSSATSTSPFVHPLTFTHSHRRDIGDEIGLDPRDARRLDLAERVEHRRQRRRFDGQHRHRPRFFLGRFRRRRRSGCEDHGAGEHRRRAGSRRRRTSGVSAAAPRAARRRA